MARTDTPPPAACPPSDDAANPSPVAAEPALLAALQCGLPLSPRPFEDLSRDLGCTEADLIDCAAVCRARGIVRRFGAVFDARRLGYRAALCAACVPPADLDTAAARVTPLSGVTHCYHRAPFPFHPSPFTSFPSLWFTLSCPADVFPAVADEVAARLAPWPVRVLPALRRYKVDVVFGAETRAREESVADDGAPLAARDRAIVGALQGDTEIRPDYFAAIAARIGMKEWDLLSTLELWRRSGRLRRIGLLLRHREAGWTANGMCCWRVDGGTEAAGRALAACGEVTHCYERPPAPEFPYNLFAMVHARAPEEAAAAFARLEASCSLSGGVMLVSTREYKKTSLQFYPR